MLFKYIVKLKIEVHAGRANRKVAGVVEVEVHAYKDEPGVHNLIYARNESQKDVIAALSWDEKKAYRYIYTYHTQGRKKY